MHIAISIMWLAVSTAVIISVLNDNGMHVFWFFIIPAITHLFTQAAANARADKKGGEG